MQQPNLETQTAIDTSSFLALVCILLVC